MVNRVTESSPPAFPLFERTKEKTRSRYARPYLDIVGTSCRGTSCRDLARWARSGSDRVILERPNLATALTQQVDSTKSLLSIVLENAPRWGRGVPLKREIRSNLVPRRGKNARLVSLLGNVERSILLIDTIEFFEVVPSYWSRTNNPASFFFFFFFLPRQIRTSTSTLVGRGLAGISYGFALVVRGHSAFEQQRRGDGLLGLRRRVLPRKNNRVPRAENLARLNRRELPPSANLFSLHPFVPGRILFPRRFDNRNCSRSWPRLFSPSRFLLSKKSVPSILPVPVIFARLFLPLPRNGKDRRSVSPRIIFSRFASGRKRVGSVGTAKRTNERTFAFKMAIFVLLFLFSSFLFQSFHHIEFHRSDKGVL